MILQSLGTLIPLLGELIFFCESEFPAESEFPETLICSVHSGILYTLESTKNLALNTFLYFIYFKVCNLEEFYVILGNLDDGKCPEIQLNLKLVPVFLLKSLNPNFDMLG